MSESNPSIWRSEDEFKDTEVGRIPKEWDIKTVEKILADIPYAAAMGPFGSNITKDNFKNEGVPVIRGSNLNSFKFIDSAFVFLSDSKADELKSSNAHVNDIVITHRGTLGQVCIIPSDTPYNRYVISQSQMKFTCNDSIANPEFIFYYLKSPRGQYQLLMNTSQTGVPALAQPLSSLRKIPVPLPPLPEQKAIAHILSTLDEKIELNRKMNKTLEEIGKAIFKHWFVDFEFPNVEGKPYKSSGGKMELNEELGKEIPKGWGVVSFGEIVEVRGGTTPSTKVPDYWDGDIPWITPKDLTTSDNIHYSTTSRYITEKGLKRISKGLLPIGTVLLTSRAPIGQVGINDIPMVTNQGFINIICSDDINNLFLLFWLKRNVELLKSNANGTTFLEISKTNFKKLILAIPEKSVMELFRALIFPVDAKITEGHHEIDVLTKQRDSLLPKFVSGEIRVKSESSL